MSDPLRLLARERALESRLSLVADRLVSHLPRLGIDENALLLIFALMIGGAVGLAVIVFYKLIDLVQAGSVNAVGRLEGIGSVAILGVVIAGLTLARWLVRAGAKDSEGENVPSVMLAVAKGGGVVHSFPVIIKTIATALAIGTGGAVGAEGPVAVGGSALGSKIGRFFRSGPARLRLLVACGAAAGISAAFNAPIAGVFFSLEKVIGSFGVSAFPPILVASVVAATIARAAFGNTPVIAIPTEYAVGAPSELVLYAILGIACGVVGVVYTRAAFRVDDIVRRVPRYWIRVLIAAAVVGLLGMVFQADLWGHGHESLSIEMIGARTGLFLLGLTAAKIIATAATLSAARCGGVFTPALFIGATLGGGLATVLRDTLGLTIIPEAFALVAMAGVVAASTHAPLTAIMIVFEMTSDYALVLPLMLCGAIAYITARRLYPQSIYSEWLARRGEEIHAGRDTAILGRLRVADVFNRNPTVVSESATVSQILDAMGTSRQIEFPVLDEQLHLLGMITHADLRAVLTDSQRIAPIVLAGDLVNPQFEAVTPDDTLHDALQRLAVRGGHDIPVVADGDSSRLVGVIGRVEILNAYDREVLRGR